jgi:hypothetical protein
MDRGSGRRSAPRGGCAGARRPDSGRGMRRLFYALLVLVPTVLGGGLLLGGSSGSLQEGGPVAGLAPVDRGPVYGQVASQARAPGPLCPTPPEPSYGIIDPCQPASRTMAIRTSRALRGAAGPNDP